MSRARWLLAAVAAAAPGAWACAGAPPPAPRPDRALLREVVVSLSRQLARPSHGDRNKALYGLAAVLDAAPELASFVEDRAGPWLGRLAEQSVLSNVGGVAAELLARLRHAASPAAPPG